MRDVRAELGARIAADALRSLPDTAPTDLLALAARLGVVAVVVDIDLPEDGRTEWTQSGPAITVRTDHSAGRGRFTLAHELGHVLREGGRATGAASRTTTLWPRAEETLCDSIAAALVLPEVGVRRELAPPLGLAQIRATAAAWRVSLAAVAVRTGVLYPGEELCLLRWRRGQDEWHLAGRAGWPMQLGHRVGPGPGLGAWLDALSDGATAGHRAALALDGRVLTPTAETRRTGRTCQMLARTDELLGAAT